MVSISVLSIQKATAQENSSPWKFGVKAGMNITNSGQNYQSSKPGFNVGGTVEYDLKNNFFLQSGLEFKTKRGKSEIYFLDYPVGGYFPSETSKSSTYTGVSNYSTTLMYLQVPLTLGYRLPISKDFGMTFNAGMYTAYRVGGRSKSSFDGYTKDADGQTTLYSWSSNSNSAGSDLNRLDFGLLGGVGFEYKKLSLNINYELGLVNLNKNNYYSNYYNGGYSGFFKNDNKYKNRSLSVSLGYKF